MVVAGAVVVVMAAHPNELLGMAPLLMAGALITDARDTTLR
jgi:hypothetical protein